ncbi:MAG: hypothetical protein AAFV07_01440, partial [Bacteroidota bacterium]
MKNLALVLALFACFSSCKNAVSDASAAPEMALEAVAAKSDVFYHYSVWYAFVNRIFEGELLASELKTRG